MCAAYGPTVHHSLKLPDGPVGDDGIVEEWRSPAVPGASGES